ncbi:DUF4097 family beta strand repeat-containing protein [Actinomadura litoris]|uniref:DUF4097 family beta strand repeat protein n=1 Tax=Actinomadura litoris TaxID=2678616 RepID=A0A7K1LAI6_9ACTN|nr:DUF4097 family beta strand repeat-containing protein [Actinomadura litoris]MUN41440.1 DUF4097 family beta strand repeat protein [Actinomadura litoris]
MPRTLVAAAPGPARLDITVPFGHVKIAAAPGCATATLTLTATTTDPALADLIDRATLHTTDHGLVVAVPKLPGTATIRTNGNFGIQVQANHGSGTFIAGDYHGANVINGQHIQPGAPPRAVSGDIEVVALVPPGSDIEVDGNAADLSAKGRLGSVTAHASSGDVDVDTADTLTVRTTSGDVHGAEVTGRTDITTTAGDISIARFGGTGDFVTSSGDVTVAAIQRGNVRARTSTGDIRVTAAPGIAEGLTVWARSSVGCIRVPDGAAAG